MCNRSWSNCWSDFPTSFEMFWTAAGLDNLIEIITAETNKYANQNDLNFPTTKEEVLALLGMNFIIAVNELPCIEECFSTDWFLGNKAIQNVMTKTRFQGILQNLHFTDNQKNDKSDIDLKFPPVMKHFNATFTSFLGNGKVLMIISANLKINLVWNSSFMKFYFKNISFYKI